MTKIRVIIISCSLFTTGAVIAYGISSILHSAASIVSCILSFGILFLLGGLILFKSIYQLVRHEDPDPFSQKE